MSNEKTIHVIATQHLDVAWLWPRVPDGEDLIRQCFERAVELIEQDSDFVFSRSTAWSFWIVQHRYPELFQKIKRYVLEGKIELCGGQWVEPDHLMPDGESLIRQFLLGQRYYLEEFGKTASVCWDPDIFGHSNTLPQILRKSGIEGYYFHRCRPRHNNGKPMHQFIWEGLDGTKVFVLSGKWVGKPDEAVLQQLTTELEQAPFPCAHIACGLHSDRRITIKPDWLALPDLSGSDDPTIRIKWSSSAEVLQDMQRHLSLLPVINGEIGFQYTGTYTSNGFNKRTNRELENLLVNAEKAAFWASFYGFTYPQEQLQRAWRDFCINQFHDIICGCSYRSVHKEDKALYGETKRRVEWIIEQATAYIRHLLFRQLHIEATSNDMVAVFDFTSLNRIVPVELPILNDNNYGVVDDQGVPLPSQQVEDGVGRKRLLILHESHGIDCKYYKFTENEHRTPNSSIAGEYYLENEFVLVEFDEKTAEIKRMFDKKRERVVFSNKNRGNRVRFLKEGNLLEHPDTHCWEPWHIMYTGETIDEGTIEVAEIKESGPIRGCIRFVRRVQLDESMPKTEFIQEFILYSYSPLLTVRMYGEWYAKEVMVKSFFEMPFTSDYVTVEAPYGIVERPVQDNDPEERCDRDLDSAMEDEKYREEVPEPDRYMQKWLDFSNGEQGVLFLNNGKYGYNAKPDQVGLSFMRAPLMRPELNEIIGLGDFDFSFGIIPHNGTWKDIQAPIHAACFNNPPVVGTVQNGKKSGVGQQWWDFVEQVDLSVDPILCFCSDESVMITAMKKSEDGNGCIVRAVETLGERRNITLSFCKDLSTACECNMLELISESQTENDPYISYFLR